MQTDDIERALEATWDDRHVSRAERKALRALVESRQPSPAQLASLRARAFHLARQRLPEAPAEQVLDWLEDVVRALQPAPVSAPSPAREAEAWFSPGEEPLACILRELRSVRRQADICVFTITDDRISDAIVAAARRGVALRVLSDDEKAGDLGSDFEKLRRAGVPAALDQGRGHLHHKFALFDDARLLTGSFNWTRAATGANHENVLVTAEASLVRAYAEEFQRLWSRYGDA
jgi:cardiolipin hydrolase